MTTDPLRRASSELFTRFSEFARDHSTSIRDGEALAEFTEAIGVELGTDISSDIQLYGHRTQAMFQDLVLTLGASELLKVEDAGDVFPAESYKVPDFRIVLPGGEQWLIEVKNVHIDEPFEQERLIMRPDYREKLQRYATATGADLKLAVFWSRWRIWTLVSLDTFTSDDGSVTLELKAAAIENEMGRLGDRHIATTPPLKLRFLADPNEQAWVADGKLQFKIAGLEFHCADREIVDPTEKNIAWTFMLYGEWIESGPHEIWDGDDLVAVEFRWEPESELNQGVEMIAVLSTMFHRYYSERTVSDDGDVVQARARPRPGWFEPLIEADYESDALPLWRFTLEPSSYFRSDEGSGAALKEPRARI